ncbi:hypothetical protein [Specibacter sp. RAF43]|uniref:hypothetical protein n=1 Tax=Specibacter sp. RAF43 TaxID=3233057 RepID=UPI003F96D813
MDQTVILKVTGKEYTAWLRDGVVLMPKALMQGPALRLVRSRRGPKLPVKTVNVNLTGLKEVPDYGPRAVTQRLVKALGNNAVAGLLDVSRDRPGRWVSGVDTPNELNQAQLTDLDALVGYLHSAFTPAQAKLWLEGQDPYLGARPLDVYRLEGAAPVIEAIRAYEQGAFA